MGQKSAKDHEKEIVECFHDINDKEKIEKLFNSFDTSKDGSLDKKEFKAFGKQLLHLMHEDGAKFPQDLVESSIDDLFEKADAVKDGRITLEEFQNFLASVITTNLTLRLAGPAGSGKSTLLYRFCDDKLLDEELCNLIFKVKSLTINDKIAKLRICDLPNESNLKDLKKEYTNYFKGGQGIVLCFDLSDQESFNKLDSLLDDIKFVYLGPNDKVKFVLAGTKSDKPRAVSEEVAKAFAEKHQLKYFEVSANNSVNVTELFTSLATDILNAQ